MSPSPQSSVARRIIDRKVIPWTLAYFMGAWALVEASKFFTDWFGWGDWVISGLFAVLAFGTLSTLTVAWYHGAAGWQRLTRREASIHVAIGAALVATLAFGPPLTGSSRTAGEPPAITRIAVHYFKDHTDGELTQLASDLTERVVHRLAQVPALDVLPMTAMESYRATPTPYDTILATLRAGSLVEGSITRMDDEIVVTAQLIEGGSWVHEASWVYSRPVARQSAVVSEVAASIADAVRGEIGRQVASRRVETGTTVPQAQALYRRAEAIMSNEASVTWWEDPEQGVALLEDADRLLAEAERLDPSWIDPTLLRIEAAEVRSQLIGGTSNWEPRPLEEAVAHATRALAMTGDSAPLLERRGGLRFRLSEYSDAAAANSLRAAAEADLRLASRMEPDRPHTLWALSQLMDRQGNFNAAYQHAARAYEADSFLELTDDVLGQLALTAIKLKKFEEAERWCREGRRLRPENQDFPMRRLLLLASLPEVGDDGIGAAWAYVDTLESLSMPDRRTSWRGVGETVVAVTLGTAGLADSADAVIRRAQQKLRRGNDPAMLGAGAYFEAAARLRLDDYDAVFPVLKRYVSRYGGRAESLADDWWFEKIWDDPRLIRLYGGSPTEEVAGGS